MNVEQRNELLQQMLETEIGGVKVYETALTCALNDDLKQEWEKYLQQTKRHVGTVETLMKTLGVASHDTPGRLVVRHIGGSLVAAMKLAKASAPPEAAEIVACECVVHAETKDHANWGFSAPTGKPRKAMRRRRSTPRSEKPRTRKTSTFTTARAGAGSYRSRVWA
jgi:hypothetical protein